MESYFWLAVTVAFGLFVLGGLVASIVTGLRKRGGSPPPERRDEPD